MSAACWAESATRDYTARIDIEEAREAAWAESVADLAGDFLARPHIIDELMSSEESTKLPLASLLDGPDVLDTISPGDALRMILCGSETKALQARRLLRDALIQRLIADANAGDAYGVGLAATNALAREADEVDA